MSVTDQRELIKRMLANLDQQIADAGALLIQLPANGAEHDTATEWLVELRKARTRFDQLVNAIGDK